MKASDVIEVVDDGGNALLIFRDQATFDDYEQAELTGTPFDFSRIEQQALDLRTKLDSFLDDLRRLVPARPAA